MIKTFAVNPFREVTYVVSDENTKKCVLVDPGASEQFEFDRIADYISKNSLTPIMIINSHVHIDHILGVDYFKKLYNIPFAASALEAPILEYASVSAKTYGLVEGEFTPPTIDIDLSKMSSIEVGDTTIEIIATPGHSSGGVCFFIDKEAILLTGDTLFQGSIGRTDLPTGDYDQLMHSIINNLLPLCAEREITVYPGHGNHTTLAQEMGTNPFINEVLTDSVNPKIEN